MGLCKDGYYRESEWFDGKKYIATGKDRKDALKKLAQKIDAAKKGTAAVNANTTVKAWSETWLDTYVKDSDITHKSYLNIKGKINCNVLPAIGTMKMKDVKDIHLQRIMNDQKGMSSSHVTKLRNYMDRMFKQAVKSHIISYNPAEDLTLPKASDRKRRPLTPAEREAILSLAETHTSGLWVLTMLYCGLRPGETIPLQWRDIDFAKRTLNVHQALESGTVDNIKAPKSDAGFRIIPIPDKLITKLEANKGKPLDYIFTQVRPENKGKHHTESSLRWYWKSFIRALDISLGATVKRNEIIVSKVSVDLTPYVLRHTYGTDLQAAGVPINVAKYLMGHSDITTTANIYTHENDNLVTMAAELINGYMVKNLVKNENQQAAITA